MKKCISSIIILALLFTVMTGCGKTDSGTVSTDGSTSMEKVIGALGEAFEENNSGVTFMNGYEATRAIRNLSRKDIRDLPIIAMTANAMEEDREAGRGENIRL